MYLAKSTLNSEEEKLHRSKPSPHFLPGYNLSPVPRDNTAGQLSSLSI